MAQAGQVRSGTRERRLSLDVLKAVACVSVVSYHARYLTLAPGGAAPLMYYVRAFIASCVPLFFFVHGFLRARRSLTVPQCLARMGKLAVLVIVWALAASLVRTLQGEPPVTGLVLDALALPQNRSNYLWFLISLSALYTVLPFVQELREKNYPLFLWAVAGAGVLCFGVDVVRKVCVVFGGEPWASVLLGFVGRFPLWGENHSYALAYGLMGMLVADGERTSVRELVEERLRGARGLERLPLVMAQGVWWLTGGARAAVAGALVVVTPVVMAAFGLFVTIGTGSEYDVSWYGYGCWSTLLLVLALYRVVTLAQSRVPRPLGRVAELVGRNTMSVYLMHMLVMLPVWTLVPREGGRAYLLVAGIVVPGLMTLGLSLVGELLRRLRPVRWLLTA